MNKDKIELYCPNRFELLFDFFGIFGIKTDEKYTKEDKIKVLLLIEELLKNKIIYACNSINGNKFERWNLSVENTITKINTLWREDTDYPEFYNLVWFGYEPWYANKLNEIGYSEKCNWEIFVKNKIENLEKWIGENKPRE